MWRKREEDTESKGKAAMSAVKKDVADKLHKRALDIKRIRR